LGFRAKQVTEISINQSINNTPIWRTVLYSPMGMETRQNRIPCEKKTDPPAIKKHVTWIQQKSRDGILNIIVLMNRLKPIICGMILREKTEWNNIEQRDTRKKTYRDQREYEQREYALTYVAVQDP